MENAGWTNWDDSLRGEAFEMVAGQEYVIKVYNWWDNAPQDCAVSITTVGTYNTISLQPAATCYVGAELFLLATGAPEFAAAKLEWEISDPSILEMCGWGPMSFSARGLAVGTTTVTVPTDTGLTASCEVTVVDTPTITGNSFDISLPARLMEQKKQIKKDLDAAIAQRETGTYYTVVTYDIASFN